MWSKYLDEKKGNDRNSRRLNNSIDCHDSGSSSDRASRPLREELLGRLPQWSRSPKVFDLPNVKRANRYLRFQSRRIDRALLEGNLEKAVFIWILNMKNSFSYQLALFNKVCKGWYYSFTSDTATSLIRKCVAKMRALDLNLVLTRFYIAKKNGKWRPIGAPNMESRVMSKALTDLLYFSMEDSFKSFQHGFRKSRGTQSALVEVLSRFLKDPTVDIYEFDFKAFFNSVSWIGVVTHIRRKSDLLAGIIGNSLLRVRCRFPEGLREESEYRDTGETVSRGKKGRKKPYPLYERFGVPQGLSLSPLLATLSLETGRAPKSLLMYADDGVLIGDSETVRKGMTWLNGLRSYGVERELTKSRLIPKECTPSWPLRDVVSRFRFLGVDFNLHHKYVQYKQFRYSFKDLSDVKGIGRNREEVLSDFRDWLRGNSIRYQDRIDHGQGGPEVWYVRRGSFMHHLHRAMKKQRQELNPFLFFPLWVFLKGFFQDRSHRGYRFCWAWCLKDRPHEVQGFYDLQTGSSQAVESVLAVKGELHLAKRRSMDTFIDRINEDLYQSEPMLKKDYVERISLNRSSEDLVVEMSQMWIWSPLSKSLCDTLSRRLGKVNVGDLFVG